MEEPLSSRKRLRRYCGHCDRELSHACFYEHKRLYLRDGVWQRETEETESCTAHDDLQMLSCRENEIKDEAADDQSIHLENGTESARDLQPLTDSISDNDEIKTEQDTHLLLKSSDSDSAADEKAGIPCLVYKEEEELVNISDFQFPPPLNTYERPTGKAAEQVPLNPASELERRLFAALDGLSRQLTQVLQDTAELKEEAANIKLRLASLEETASPPRESSGASQLKKRRRAFNPKIAETVRRLHNSEGNGSRYDPAQGLSSPHNRSVTSRLVAALAQCPDSAGVDTKAFVLAAKTYYETIRKKFRYSQPGHAQKAEAMKCEARSRQRRKRLMQARRGVVAESEMAIWTGVTADLMSDEEESTDEVGWIVRPPAFRSQELSDLCRVLQERLEKDPKYALTHRKRLRTGSASQRAAPPLYDPDAAKRHLKPC